MALLHDSVGDRSELTELYEACKESADGGKARTACYAKYLIESHTDSVRLDVVELHAVIR